MKYSLAFAMVLLVCVLPAAGSVDISIASVRSSVAIKRAWASTAAGTVPATSRTLNGRGAVEQPQAARQGTQAGRGQPRPLSVCRTTGPRTICNGRQVAYQDAGPELWAQRFRREHRLRLAAEHQLALLRMCPPTCDTAGWATAHVTAYASFERDFLCIYNYENGGYGWTANTGNGYYGGLQMDREFQATYGPEFVKAFGTANNWPVSVQIAVAIRAYLSGRGFHPWPNTARSCGLLP